MQALIIGATGATGKDLIELLLKDDSFHQIHIFVRRSSGIQHPKIIEHIINFDDPETWKPWVKGDVLFSCLGTTLKAAGSKEAQWKIDYDYQYEFAKAASENNIEKYILVSSGGADAKSSIFYSMMKGKLEDAVKLLKFRSLYIFNPPLLLRKNTDRPVERIAEKILFFFNKVGLFLSQKPLPTAILAQALINAVKENKTGLTAYKEKEIWALAAKK